MAATDIAVVGYAQTPSSRRARESEVQLLVPIVTEALQRSGLDRREVGFTCAGSCDYLTGGPFAFVSNLEAAGAWPPISESHVEMDGAWALYERPAWIRGLDHRIEVHQPGMRDLTTSASTTLAARKAGYDGGPLDVIELSSTFSPQELILRDALGIDADANVNPSGGPLAANPVMATGLVRIVEAASRVIAGDARRGLAHATGGQLLQHNLVCLLEGEE